MSPETPMEVRSGQVTPASARLLIHTLGDSQKHAHSKLAVAVLAIRMRFRLWRNGQPMGVFIDEVGGKRIATLENAGKVVDVPLAPGTYKITVHRGRMRRSYTLTLEADARFDLYLSLADVLH